MFTWEAALISQPVSNVMWGIFKHAWDPLEHLMCDLRGIRQSHANTELAWAVSNLIANRNQYGSLFETKTSAAKCI